MEPIDLNPSDPTDQSLDALLRTHAGETLPDGDFSARVLASLPPKRKSFFGARTWLTLCLLAALALVLGPRLWGNIHAEASALGSAFDPLLTALSDPVLLLVLAISAGVWLLSEDEDDAIFAATPPTTKKAGR